MGACAGSEVRREEKKGGRNGRETCEWENVQAGFRAGHDSDLVTLWYAIFDSDLVTLNIAYQLWYAIFDSDLVTLNIAYQLWYAIFDSDLVTLQANGLLYTTFDSLA